MPGEVRPGHATRNASANGLGSRLLTARDPNTTRCAPRTRTTWRGHNGLIAAVGEDSWIRHADGRYGRPSSVSRYRDRVTPGGRNTCNTRITRVTLRGLGPISAT